MAWSYSGNPASSDKDAVRFLVGDTRTDDGVVSDEEINWALSQNSNIYAAASVIADGISTYFSTLADSEEIGPIKVQYSNRVKYYSQKAKDLSSKVSTIAEMIVYGGGIEVSDKETANADDTLLKPIFTIGMNDMTTTLYQEERTE